MPLTGSAGQADAMLAALTLMTEPDLPIAFAAGIPADEINHGFGLLINEAVARISLASGQPMNQAAVAVFAELNATAPGPTRPLLASAAKLMGAAWRGEAPEPGVPLGSDATGPLTLLATVLLRREASGSGVDWRVVIESYRDRAMRLAVGA